MKTACSSKAGLLSSESFIYSNSDSGKNCITTSPVRSEPNLREYSSIPKMLSFGQKILSCIHYKTHVLNNMDSGMKGVYSGENRNCNILIVTTWWAKVILNWTLSTVVEQPPTSLVVGSLQQAEHMRRNKPLQRCNILKQQSIRYHSEKKHGLE
jgi:hypothetical protein